jgi:hypothetical protein
VVTSMLDGPDQARHAQSSKYESKHAFSFRRLPGTSPAHRPIDDAGAV